MTAGDLASVVKSMAPVIREYVAGIVGGLADRLSAVEQQIKALPVPTNGKDGTPGEIGPMGPTGPKGDPGESIKGEKGDPGRDGKDVDPAVLQGLLDEMRTLRAEIVQLKSVTFVIDEAGDLLQATGTEFKRIGRVRGYDGMNGKDGLQGPAGIDGRDGKDGADGLGFEDMDMEYDAHRTFTFKFVRGEIVKAFPFAVSLPVYQGVFEKDMSYVRSDIVTWGGHAWYAKSDPTGKPGFAADADRAWVLLVKAGRDGKSGPAGPAGKDGKDGRPGLDLTQMDSTGRKW